MKNDLKNYKVKCRIHEPGHELFTAKNLEDAIGITSTWNGCDIDLSSLEEVDTST